MATATCAENLANQMHLAWVILASVVGAPDLAAALCGNKPSQDATLLNTASEDVVENVGPVIHVEGVANSLHEIPDVIRAERAFPYIVEKGIHGQMVAKMRADDAKQWLILIFHNHFYFVS